MGGSLVVVAFAAVGAAAAWLVFKAAPRLTIAVWVLTLFFIPIWVGLSAGVFYTAITGVTLLAVATSSLRGFRWHGADTAILAFAAMVSASLVLGHVIFGHWLIAALDWVVPYIWGRLVLGRVRIELLTSWIAAATVGAAVLALIEFGTGRNLFVLVPWPGGSYALWSELQPRGGFLRAEGAFGHSIALGASLSVGSLFVLTARWELRYKLVALALVGAAVVVTFSRIGLVGFVLGMILAVLFLGPVIDWRTRLAVSVSSGLAAVVVIPFISGVFTSAGDEAEGSALYRLDLLDLVSQMAPVGLSPGYIVLPDNAVYVGDFESIDSALILIGVRLGWVPLLLLVGLLVAAVVLVVRRGANVPLVALVAQIPGLATVALITQLPHLLWFVGGLGVSLYILNRGRARETASTRGEPVSEREGN